MERFLEAIFCPCQALFAIRPGSAQWYQTGVLSASVSFLEIGRSHRVPNVGSTVGGGVTGSVTPENTGLGRKCETRHCHGEAATPVLVRVRGNVFARFYAVAAKRRSRSRNSKFGLLGAACVGLQSQRETERKNTTSLNTESRSVCNNGSLHLHGFKHNLLQ
jgi:hypothetical protein